MRTAIGSDHAGFEMKGTLAQHPRDLGHEAVDVGTYSTEAVDYPDFVEAAGKAVLDGRAGLCHDTYSAHQGVEHDDMNILLLGACVIDAFPMLREGGEIR